MPRTFIARITVLLGLTGVAVVAVEAQQPPRQRPDTPLAQGVVPLSEVEVLDTPLVDLLALQAEDMNRESAGLPPRFASPFVVSATPSNSGLWEASDDGRRVWRLRVGSPGSVSISLGFTQYVMPSGGRLFLYTPDYEEIVGPFTDLDNESHRELWTPLLSGGEVVIEVSLPGDRPEDLVLEVGSVNRGYRTFADINKSGSCNVDVLCAQGDAWRPQIRAVGAYSTGGTIFCTGAMINNTSGDGKPYFLTANHCGITSGSAASVVVYWNFVNSVCRTPGSPESGGDGNGSQTQFQTGAFFRASYEPTDFTLIELDDAPNTSHAVFLAGWDRGGADAASATAIHHPNGEEKRISFENNPTTVTSFGGTIVPGDATHVRITDWDLGTTEPGSSGSPLFDQNRRIIGQLHGGGAACGNDLSDWYGRLATSWTGGGASSSRLSNWLDPGNTGATTIDGREATSPPVSMTINDLTVTEGNIGTKNATFTVSLSAATTSTVTVSYATADETATSGSKSNTTALSIPSSGNASPYPSTIPMPAGLGTISRASVVLRGFSHTFPEDVDVLLAGPGGQTVMLMSDVGGDIDATNLTLTFDDGGPALPSGMLSSGTFRPTNNDSTTDTFTGPAPGPPYGSTLAGFNATDPTGNWSLFVRDDVSGDTGSFSGGWSLVLTIASPDYAPASGTLTISAGATSGPIAVTINGDTTLEASETFTLNLSNASGATITDGSGTGTITNDDFSFTDHPLTAGTFVKGIHIIELRDAINAVRAARSVPAFGFTDPTLPAQIAPIKALHITELRTALAQAYSAVKQPTPTYTDPTITAGTTVVKAVHISEIRAAVSNIP